MSEADGEQVGVEYEGNEVIVDVIGVHHDFYGKAQREGKRVVASYGGAGSGKSVSMAQWFVLEAIKYRKYGLRQLCAMKTRPALRDAQWKEVHRVLDSWKVEYEERESSYDIWVGKSSIHFRGLDDPDKLKSFSEGFNQIWVEEATATDTKDFLQLQKRLRRRGPVPLQIYLTFNPVDGNHYTWTDVVQSHRSDVAVLHTTYKDNPFLPREYTERLEDREIQDENHYRIYTLGEPGIFENQIYLKWDELDWGQVPESIRVRANEPDAYGYDFGYTHPLCLVAYWEHEGEDYIRELVYTRKMTTEALAVRMKEDKVSQSVEVWCPPEQPGVIDYLCAKGYNAKPVPKECRNVKDGIDYCKGRKLHIIRGSDNIIKEIKGYSYKMRKDGTVTEDPIKVMNDAMDAMRYARVSMRSLYQLNAPAKDGVRGRDRLLDMMDEISKERAVERGERREMEWI